MSRRLWTLALAVGLLTATACGLPGKLHDKAESLKSRIEREDEAVEVKAGQLASFLADDDNAYLAVYAERESWAGRFDEARTELGHARAIAGDELGPLLEADRSDDEALVEEQLGRLAGSLDRVVLSARKPAQRAAFLADVRDRAPEIVRGSAAATETARAELQALRAEVERGAADYPEKAEDLGERLAAVRRTTDEATESQRLAEAELGVLERGSRDEADLAVLGDSATAVLAGAAAVAASDRDIRQKVGELYRSYSKTLLDMKEEATVSIGRTSWNESVDFARETEAIFKVRAAPEDLDVLDAWGDRPIATISSFFGRTSLNVAIDQRLWDSFRIDPLVSFPRGDDSAEFWIGDTEALYFHRYAVVENDEQRETDWEPVSEAVYEEHYDDLGMDIVAKPYGMYEDEALHEAAPPGMAYVGNPKYGRWEEDEQGRRRWSWGQSFLFYYLVFGGPRHHYYHRDWNHYRGYRGRSAWYGSNSTRADYGTYGSRTRKSARYAGSGFAGAGGFAQADRSIRGAGPRGRGGGPGGGGK
jgi:hypothetical protein